MKHTQKMRNSSIELLRVISMLMVVAHHFVVHNLDNAWDINGDSSRFLIAVFAAPLGKISIVSFFAVTAVRERERLSCLIPTGMENGITSFVLRMGDVHIIRYIR